MEVKELTQDYARRILKANGKELKVKVVIVGTEFSLQNPDGEVVFGSKGDVLIQKAENVEMLSRSEFDKLYK
jgi:uncharacterized protein YxjI